MIGSGSTKTKDDGSESVGGEEELGLSEMEEEEVGMVKSMCSMKSVRQWGQTREEEEEEEEEDDDEEEGETKVTLISHSWHQ